MGVTKPKKVLNLGKIDASNLKDPKQNTIQQTNYIGDKKRNFTGGSMKNLSSFYLL